MTESLPPLATETSITTALEKQLAELASTSRLRQLKTMSHPVRPKVILNQKAVLDFCHNDYLGLSQHPALKQAAQTALAQYGTGTGGARLIGGTFDLHTLLEERIAQLKSTPAALLFNSGYQANVGILSALAHRHAVIFADKLNHASLVDGAVLSRAKLIRYPHLDLDALEIALQKTPRETLKLIVTDTVFSMDGDLAPLTDLFDLAERYDTWLVLDEAHGTGIFGAEHRSGLWETTGIRHHPRVIQIGTFSKALGSFGAYVASSEAVRQTLIQTSRSFIYSTSLPPAVVASNLAALEVLQTEPQWTQTLWKNIEHFRHQSIAAGQHWPVQSPIIPIITNDSETTLKIAQSLMEQGFYVQAIRPPTVPEGTSRLRITLSASHSIQQINHLIAALVPILS